MGWEQGLSRVIFLGSLGVLLLHFSYCFYGHFGYDDLHYARLAAALSEGRWDATDHYSYRLTLLLPTALLYRWLGVSDLASALPPLLMSAVILWVLYGRHGGSPKGYLLAVLLYFSFRWNLFYADKLMPDIYVSGFAFLAWDRYARSEEDGKVGWRPLFFVLYLFLAFNAKGTIILLLPLLAVYGLYDLWRGKAAFWWRSAGVGTLIFGFYFLLTQWYLGHPLARFRAIAANAYSNTCSYAEQDWRVLWHRLTSGFWELLYQEGLWLPLVVGLLSVGYCCLAWFNNAAPSKRAEKNARLAAPLFYSLTIVLLYASANTMTISFSGYNPVCLDVRHWLFVSPIAVSCSISLWMYYLERGRPKWQLYGYALLLAVGLWGAKSSLSMAVYGRSMGYAAVKKELQQLLSDPAMDGKEVVASPVLVHLADYLAGFPEEPSIHFEDSKTVLPQAGDYLVKNWYCDWHAQLSEEYYPQRLEQQGLTAKPIQTQMAYHLLVIEIVE